MDVVGYGDTPPEGFQGLSDGASRSLFNRASVSYESRSSHVASYKHEISNYIREIGSQASWQVSSSKYECGIEHLKLNTGLKTNTYIECALLNAGNGFRGQCSGSLLPYDRKLTGARTDLLSSVSPSRKTYWQSDGTQPHRIEISFPRLVLVSEICLLLDHPGDDSYTPSRVHVRCGTSCRDAEEILQASFSSPTGWVSIQLRNEQRAVTQLIAGSYFALDFTENHENGRDSRVHGLKIYGLSGDSLHSDKSIMLRYPV